MELVKVRSETMKFEYNLLAQRVFPWNEAVNAPFEGAWCVLSPGQISTPHNHIEKEVFIIFKGSGIVENEGERVKVSEGDVIFCPPYTEHFLINDGEVPMKFFSLFWVDPQTNRKALGY